MDHRVDRVQKSFRLVADVSDVLDRVSRRDGVSQTSIVEAAVRQAYTGDGPPHGTRAAAQVRIAALRDELDRLESAVAALPA